LYDYQRLVIIPPDPLEKRGELCREMPAEFSKAMAIMKGHIRRGNPDERVLLDMQGRAVYNANWL
jgi:hypothetical protein